MAKITKTGSNAPASKEAKMIEKAIKNAKDYPSKMELWKSLPKQIPYKELRTVLCGFEKTNRIIFTKDNKVMWIFADTPKSRKLIENAKEY